MAGSAARDNEALGRELAAFRDRLEVAGLQRAVMQEADLVLSQALAAHAVYGDGSEGGPA
ncbi:MAG: hypothetical protein HOY75_08375 [Streptomyces sp.]|nr:hypothetical protein [Streptomyces sp.]